MYINHFEFTHLNAEEKCNKIEKHLVIMSSNTISTVKNQVHYFSIYLCRG